MFAGEVLWESLDIHAMTLFTNNRFSMTLGSLVSISEQVCLRVT